MNTRTRAAVGVAAFAAFAMLAFTSIVAVGTAEARVAGGIHTTDIVCDGTDLNLYQSKLDVYVEGGPIKDGAAGLTDGWYGVQVTSPSGILLGESDGEPIEAVDGEFPCYQLWAIVDQAPAFLVDGYIDTPNPGGVYKVAVCLNSNFDKPADCKYDNFKVVLTPPPADACTEHAGRIIFTWGSLRIGDHASLDQQTVPTATSIAAGTYAVTLQSYDDHLGHPDQNQLQEQWFAVFRDGGDNEIALSGIIDDLPEDVNVLNQAVGEVTFEVSVESVIARHKLFGGAFPTPESVGPACLALDPVHGPD